MQQKTIVVLANSVKSSLRCLAGKELIANGDKWEIGGWIRPVSTKEGGGVSLYAMTEALGHEPQLLEIIEIPFSEATPLPFQPENWLIEKPEKGSWKSQGMFPREKTDLLVDESPEFWHDPQGSARKVKEGWPQKMKKTASLYLIKPDKIHSVGVWTQRNTYPGAEKPSQKRRVISATHQGHLHEFDIDDPKFAEKYYPKFPGLGEPKIDIALAKPQETLLCVSLAGLWYGYHYKIAAAVFEPLLDEAERK
jgi:hypothetical protein